MLAMIDIFSKAKRSEIMAQIRSKDTKPERRVRNFLFRLGFRYRLHCKSLPGSPDLVFPKFKTVVFVHGCFWHAHPCKIGSGKRKPKTNTEYWNQKIRRNKLRDKNNRKKLSALGWEVVVVWECKTLLEKDLLSSLRPLIIMRNHEA